jgi:hypothetical protein
VGTIPGKREDSPWGPPVALLGAALPSTDGRPHDVSRSDPGQMPRLLRSSRWALRSSGRARRSPSCRRSASCCRKRTTWKPLRRRLEPRERRDGSASTVFCTRYPQKDWHWRARLRRPRPCDHGPDRPQHHLDRDRKVHLAREERRRSGIDGPVGGRWFPPWEVLVPNGSIGGPQRD